MRLWTIDMVIISLQVKQIETPLVIVSVVDGFTLLLWLLSIVYNYLWKTCGPWHDPWNTRSRVLMDTLSVYWWEISLLMGYYIYSIITGVKRLLFCTPININFLKGPLNLTTITLSLGPVWDIRFLT